MKRVIADILDEKFRYETGSVDFSCPKLELTVKSGDIVDGTFTIRTNEEIETEGFVLTTGIRMQCNVDTFHSSEQEVYYRFDAKGMTAGEVEKGEFKVICTQGEYYLPYVVVVENDIADSTLGEIKNMFQFANLAKTNWEEAVQLFYTAQFENTFLGNDKRYLSLYKGLSMLPRNGQNVEEFLIAIHKKQKIEYTLKESRLQLYDPEEIVAGEVEIIRNGWGYTSLTIRAEGEFLSLEKETITDDDFLGNKCKVVFYVDSDKLHAGRNIGMIQIESPYRTLQALVTVVNTPKRRFAIGIKKERKQLVYDLMRLYLDFRMKKVSSSVWLQQTGDIIDRLNNIDDRDPASRLFQAQLLITQERYHEAEWVLERSVELLEGHAKERELTCYYLYLTTLCTTDVLYVDEVARKVRKAYQADASNFRIAWLLLYLDEEYNKSPAKKWMFMEEQYGKGCTSPLLYVEAMHLLNANPAFLMQLSNYTISLLRFGLRYDALTEDVVRQVCYLADKQKEFKQNIYTLLTECYDLYPETELLQSICIMLVKGDKLGEAYLSWYEMAVEEDLRITRLYEHYMMSLPLDYAGKLPKLILMYFAYNNNLSYERRAFLYAYVLKNNEDYPELYRTYVPEMERFVIEQLQKGRMNKELAYLYKKLLTPQMIQGDNATMLADILFTELITVENPDITHVVVVYDRLKTQFIYPLMSGKAYIPLYGSNYTVLLEDKRGNRYVESMPYILEKLLIPGKLAKQAAPFVGEHLALDMYMCEGDRDYIVITEDNVRRVQNLMNCEQIKEDYKDEIAMKLTEFYYENDMIRELDAHLTMLKPDKMNVKERGTVIRYLTVRGMYDMAFQWMKEYGTGGVEAKTIVRFSRRILEHEPDLYDDKLTEIMYAAFKQGKYDESMLQYLAMHYKGLTKEMRDIWKACMSYEVDTYMLSERILIQMLYSGTYIGERMDVFAAYLRGGAKTEVKYAFLSQAAFDYFVKDSMLEDMVFHELARIFKQGEKLNTISRLAFLKFFAMERDSVTDEIKPIIEAFIEELLRDSIYFSFYRSYADMIPALQRIADRTYIEYKASPNTKVMLHYVIKKDNEDNNVYKTEQMRNMYGGTFVKVVILFYGECLQYYITEEADGKEHLTESRTIYQNEEEKVSEGGRFTQINDIALASTMQDYDTVHTMLQEYFELDMKVNALFKPLSGDKSDS